MREIQVSAVTEAIAELCIEANYELSSDMKAVFEQAKETEEAPLGRQICR